MNWQEWIKNKESLKKYLKTQEQKGVIKKGATKTEIKGHLQKAKRNLIFSKKIINEFKDYYEWTITSYYYAVYQASLALIAKQGYKTKSHAATIALIIKHYHPTITEEEINLINKEEIKELITLKQYREEATYSISTEYEKELTTEISKKAINFVNKAEQIIEEKL